MELNSAPRWKETPKSCLWFQRYQPPPPDIHSTTIVSGNLCSFSRVATSLFGGPVLAFRKEACFHWRHLLGGTENIHTILPRPGTIGQ